MTGPSKETMSRVNEMFNTEVFVKRNYDALEQVYTADARILPPGVPMITGREAIREFWSGLIETANAKSAVLTSLEVMPSADGAVEIGQAVLMMEAQNGVPAEMEVKYVVCRREEEGQWKWHVDIWNQNA